MTVKTERYGSSYPKKVTGRTITGTVQESFHSYAVRVPIMDKNHFDQMVEWCEAKGPFDAVYNLEPEMEFTRTGLSGILIQTFFNARFRTKEDAALFRLFWC